MRWLTSFLAWVWCTFVRTRKAEMQSRIKRRLGISDHDAVVLVRKVYRQMSASLVEVLTGMTAGRLLATTTIEGWRHLSDLHRRREGFVVVTAHTGNWELLTHLDTLCGIHGGFVSKQFSVPFFQRLLHWTRRRSLESYNDQGSARLLLRKLRDGHSVGFAVDQHTNEASALSIDFLGRSAWWSTAPARLARLASVPIVPIRTYRRNGCHVIEVHEPLNFQWSESRGKDIKETTEWYASVVEGWIQQKPEQWLWLHRRWKPQRRTVRVKDGS